MEYFTFYPLRTLLCLFTTQSLYFAFQNGGYFQDGCQSQLIKCLPSIKTDLAVLNECQIKHFL